MAIYEIHIDNVKQWDNAVRECPKYDVFYLSGYLRAFQLQGSGEPILIVYTDENDRAINAVFKRDVADDKHFSGKLEKGKYFDISTPYGYGGFFGEITDFDKLNREWKQYCIERGYVCECVRFELFGEYRSYYGGEVLTRTHNVVRDLEMPLEEMWMDFKQKVRKNVKRAAQYQLELILDPDGAYLDDFLRIYNSTMDRNHAEDVYYFGREFFQTLNTMKDNIMYFHVAYEGKIISTELVIYGSENCYSYLGGTDRDYFEMRPNDFLKHEIIKWAKEKGLKSFVLGGGYGADDGIYEYKKNLAPHGITDFWIGRRVLDQSKYEELMAMRSTDDPLIDNTSFFPAYRAGGYFSLKWGMRPPMLLRHRRAA